MGRGLTWLGAALLALAISACGNPHEILSNPDECSACHGDSTRAATAANPLLPAAPPLDHLGNSTTTSPGVGAHQVHLRDSAMRGALTCADCHTVPTNLYGHPSGTVNLTWGALATAAGATPAWNGSNDTCSGVYCHGATLDAGGTNVAPVWTKVDGTQAACGTCHAVPPPYPGHPQRTDCGSCHPGYTQTTVNPGTHINGTVDLSGLYCTVCHGDPTRAPTAANPQLAAAPPVDPSGNSATTAVGVGAHQSHLNPGPLGAAVSCTECHAVPANLESHPNGKLNLTWGPLATSGGAAPSFSLTGATCSNTYCHGATLGAGGTNHTPVWNVVDGSQDACGTCHGVPPPAASGHPQLTNCGACHPGYTQGSVNPVTHVNGKIDFGEDCTACHGDPGRAPSAANPRLPAAPPVDPAGNSATSAVGVGAHQAHLNAGALSAAVSCTECHLVPTGLGHPSGTVNITWGPLATADGALPTWDLASATCASTYCHGSTLNAGGTNHTPIWTTVDGTQDACGTCHDLPPPAATGHPQNTDCGGCHLGYTPTSVDVTKHVNGQVDARGQTCTSCHGNRAQIATPANPLFAAPPVDPLGNSATTAIGVGAHQAHVNAGAIAGPIACDECHVVPTNLNSHPSGTVNLTWGVLATTGGAAPSFNPAGATCSNTYCHGTTLNAGGTNHAPTWTIVDGTQDACGTCHAIPPPPSTGHPVTTRCGACHPGYTESTVNVATHINGTVEVYETCTSCHGDSTKTATPTDPLYAAPPLDVSGDTATTFPGVGAHQSHLNAGALSLAIACTECHVVPSSTADHPTGTLNVTFGFLATTNNASPQWNAAQGTCSGVYCHGAIFSTGGTLTTPNWTTVNGTQAACGTCHGIHPNVASGHPVSLDCGGCHCGYTPTTVNLAHHVNGTVDVDCE